MHKQTDKWIENRANCGRLMAHGTQQVKLYQCTLLAK